jgi:hypothetical protein
VNKEDMTVDETKLRVMWEDFEIALTEVQPKFGAPTADLEAYFSNGIVQYGEGFSEMERRLNAAVGASMLSSICACACMNEYTEELIL